MPTAQRILSYLPRNEKIGANRNNWNSIFNTQDSRLMFTAGELWAFTYETRSGHRTKKRGRTTMKHPCPTACWILPSTLKPLYKTVPKKLRPSISIHIHPFTWYFLKLPKLACNMAKPACFDPMAPWLRRATAFRHPSNKGVGTATEGERRSLKHAQPISVWSSTELWGS